MKCPIAFYNNEKDQKLLMTSCAENVQKPKFLTFNLPQSPN